MTKIILDVRLPSELVTQKTTWSNNDRITVQADGESVLAGITLGNLIGSEYPAELGASAHPGTANSLSRSDHVHPYGNLIGSEYPAELGASAHPGTANSLSRSDHVHPYPPKFTAITPVTVGSTPLSTSFTDQMSMTVYVSGTTKVLLMVSLEASAVRDSGSDPYGTQFYVRQGGTTISPTMYVCRGYDAVSGPSGLGGSSFWWDVRTISSNTVFTVRAALVESATSGLRYNGRIQAFLL